MTWAVGDLLNTTNLNAKAAKLQDHTYSAAAFAGASNEAKITAAIAQAVTDGFSYVFVPTSMLPYNASLVTFNSAVLMVREGGNFSADACDVQAYGAKGDGIQDDTAAIQAAINHAVAFPGRYVYFPDFPSLTPPNTNNYFITTTLTAVGGPLRMYGNMTNPDPGTGKQGPFILGNFNGTLLSVDGQNGKGFIIRGVGFRQLSSGTSAKCLTYQNVNAPSSVDDCYFNSGFDGVIAGANTFGMSFRNVYFESGSFLGTALFVFGHTTLQTITFVGWNVGFMHGQGTGTFWGGGRCEVNKTAVILGQDYATGNRVVTSGFQMTGISFEANDTAIYVRQIQDSVLSGLHITGSVNSPSTTAIYGIRTDTLESTVFAGIGIATIGGINWVQGGVTFSGNQGDWTTFISVRNLNSPTWVNVPQNSGIRFIHCNVDEPSVGISGATPDTQMSTFGPAAVYRINSSGTVTNFLNGLVGRPLYLLSVGGGTTLQHGTNIFLKSGADVAMTDNQTVTLMQFGRTAGRWDEI